MRKIVGVRQNLFYDKDHDAKINYTTPSETDFYCDQRSLPYENTDDFYKKSITVCTYVKIGKSDNKSDATAAFLETWSLRLRPG